MEPQTFFKTKKTTKTSKNNIILPRIIHFIWAGGKVRCSDDNLEIIKWWAEKNPHWKIWFWVDKETDPRVVEEHYSKNDLLQTINISFHDIGEEGLRDEYVAYELDKLMPNYGSSSDLLRYKILYQYGGAYFDMDVYPGETGLDEELPETDFNSHVLYVDHCSQMSTPKDSASSEVKELFKNKLKLFNYSGVGNDTLICTKANPLMLKILNEAMHRYNRRENIYSIQCAYSGRDIRQQTIERTGPDVIRDILSTAVSKEDNLEIDNVTIKRARDGIKSLTEPAPSNTELWLNAQIEICSLKEALKRVEKTVFFEIKHFGIIRIDDHVSDVIAASEENLEDKKIQSISFISKVCQDHLDQDYLVQVTGLYPEFIALFEKRKCKVIFQLEKNDLKTALNTFLAPWFLERNFLDSIVKNCKQDKKFKSRFLGKVEKFAGFLEEKLNFVKAMIKYEDQFSFDNIQIFIEKTKEIMGLYEKFHKNTKEVVLNKKDAYILEEFNLKISEIMKALETIGIFRVAYTPIDGWVTAFKKHM